MNNQCIKLKSKLEQAFSMPFVLSSSIIDNEEQYTCYPSNSEELLFTVKTYIHSHIRLIVEINPQENARNILNEMSNADTSKQKIFFQYIDVLNKAKGRVHFEVNNEIVSSKKDWPESWRFFKCRIDLLPIPEIDGENDVVNLLAEWMIHGTALILSLLTVEESLPQIEPSVQSEGGSKEVKSIRYERSRINREICLAHKGYSCYVCGFNFLKKYGQLGKDFIEVHHTTPVSEMGDEYEIDIDRDLVPVCSNCHSMLHKRKPPFSIEELKDIIVRNEGNNNDIGSKIDIIKISTKYFPNSIPLYTLQAACGYFEDGKIPDEERWVDAIGHGFIPDPKKNFAIYAKGYSMLPKIKDGDLCVFEWYTGGSRNGEIVLTQSSEFDPEYDGKFTIKKYYSEKKETTEGWQHTKVELLPLNPDYKPIELDEAGNYRTIGILKCVL